MITFDWKRFCSQHGIEYVLHGPNVAHDNINIQCPFCEDPSHHLGLSIRFDRPFWGCWRCRTAGRHPYHLVLSLLGDRRLASAAIAEQQQDEAFTDTFDSLFTKNTSDIAAKARAEKTMPRTFMRLAGYVGNKVPTVALRYLNYLHERHFPNPLLLSTMADLHFSVVGDYAGRIILPIYVEGRLVSWVGRKITDIGSAPRYKTEDSGDLKRCIANMDTLEMEDRAEKKALLVSEGPFDFLKLEAFMSSVNCHATCTFGTAWTDSQLMLLARYARRFGHTFVVYDKEARMEGMQLVSALREVASTDRVTATFIPGRKDPGEMRESDIPLFVKMLNAMLG